MNLEQAKALGLSEEDAKKVAEASQTELKDFIPKTRFDEVNETNKQLKQTVADNTAQLETLKASAGDNETLKNQITTLQADNQKKDSEYQAQLKDLQISNAIKLAIADKAQDADLVSGLFDKTKLILGDDGKITGLDEQVKTLKEGKPFLFKAETTETNKQNQFRGLAPGGSNTNSLDQNKQAGTFSMKNAITSRIQSQMENNNTN